MRPFPLLFQSMITVFLISGCITPATQMHPTQGTQTPSYTIVPATATTIPTLTWTPTTTDTETPMPTETATMPTTTPSRTNTLTPIDTLEPNKALETIQPLLKDPMNCDVACFWGIIPGQTSMYEVRDFFGSLGFSPFEGTDPLSGKYFYTISYESSIGRDSHVTLFPVNNLVENIRFSPEIIKQKEGSPRDWIAYSPETLIKKFGKPSDVRFGLDWGPNFVIVMIMYFEEKDLIALYSGYNMIPDRPKSPLLCPLTAPFDKVMFWLGPNPPDPPLTGEIDPLEKSIPLEEATSLTIDLFTQLMLGDPKQACFIINGKVFPNGSS